MHGAETGIALVHALGEGTGCLTIDTVSTYLVDLRYFPSSSIAARV